MHELSIALNIVEIAEEELARHGGNRIKAVHLRLGVLALAKEALTVISDAAFAAAFAPGSRAEAPIVGVLPNGRQIAGVIDRLAITGDSILAVDFKTDRPAPKDPAAIPAAYVAQLAAYAAALESALPGRTIRCAILWTEAPALIEIPPARLAAARAALS